MNENIDLTKILANAPKGLKLYTPIYGVVTFRGITKDNKFNDFPIVCSTLNGKSNITFRSDGKYYRDGECALFPSKDKRDWSKFGKYKKPLMPFQKVLVRESSGERWRCDFYSHYDLSDNIHYCTSGFAYENKNILPYEGNEYRLGTVTE